MITPLLALALLTPADTPIEPVDSLVVEVFLATPEATELCGTIEEMSDLISTLGVIAGEDVSFIFDMAVSFWQDAAENGFGETAAMTAEAEEAFRGWVYDCGGRINL